MRIDFCRPRIEKSPIARFRCHPRRSALRSSQLMTVITMSDKELERMQVLRDLSTKQITVSEAAGLMRLTRRQVFRLAKRYRQDGPPGLVSRRRGRPSNRSHPAAVRTEALALIKANYADFGPTLAAEKLAECHDLRLGVETLRQWMRADGIWKDRQQRLPRVYQPRYRRASLGELIQIDGSEHWWFEDRGPQCTLLAFVDDATSRIMHAGFVATESTFDYFRATRAYLERYGKPVAFYSDKHAIFRVNSKEAQGGDGMTQFGRALDELTIEIICANAPQSKGRVERCFGTLKDRLVKELRLAGIDTPEAGNAFLPGLLEEQNEGTGPLARQRVTVGDYPDGRLAIKHKGRELPYRVFDKRQRVNQAAIVENKRLGPVLAYIAERQTELDMSRSKRAPSRRGQAAGLFKVG